MKAIRDGVITKAARIEIISSLHTMMMQHKRYPKPAEYHAACGKLIEKHPLLADKTSSGFVSCLNSIPLQLMSNLTHREPGKNN